MRAVRGEGVLGMCCRTSDAGVYFTGTKTFCVRAGLVGRDVVVEGPSCPTYVEAIRETDDF
jgi:hypothetical protein